MKVTRRVLGLAFLVVMFSAASAGAAALHEYVEIADANFVYPQYSEAFDLLTLTTAYMLEMTSQAWRGPSEVDTVWWTHWVTIIVPEGDLLLGETKPTALVVIAGGDITDPAPAVDDSFRVLAAATRTVIIGLQGIPNQPLLFADESISRSEDEIIAYSWDKFLAGGDSFWPVQLPMVKAVVRCMDAVEQFVDAEAGKTITNFVLTGGSKRGWTAWLTAAVDDRVSAIAPIVSDLLNMPRSFAHHWAAYGFWAEALQPYEDMGIFDWLDTARGEELMAIVDPYEYRADLDMPKFIINAAGDDFFVMDSIQFYIDGLIGETYLRHVPNANHYLDNVEEDVLNSVLPYYAALLNNEPRPQFSWSLQADGSIRIDVVDEPKAVYLWQADNLTSRDFRLTTTGAVWQSSVLLAEPDGSYLAQVPDPAQGWTAFLAELVYESPFQGAGQYDYHFTTELTTVPGIRPFEADINRDTVTDAVDLMALSDIWLYDVEFYDTYPRRLGDDIIDLSEFSLLSYHWLEGN